MKRFKIGRQLLVALVVAGFAAVPADAQQAGERYTILVPFLAPQNGARDNFGEDVAKELRKLIALQADEALQALLDHKLIEAAYVDAVAVSHEGLTVAVVVEQTLDGDEILYLDSVFTHKRRFL